ncbi:ion transporter [Solimonas marina]|uniref:Ion transporter n=1 Tax=Solimonas marina TaxID=2714601 RepID=A0A969WAP8_9GAMM|nr:ion transporter [Solimonas marina]NKF23702.1 ion transporter [Solimonas marina]
MHEHQRTSERRRIAIIDWVMLILALASIALLGYDTWGPATEAQEHWIVIGDLAFCAIFFVEFMWRWRRARWELAFLKRNWYEILGMIPAAHPALRAFRLFRVVRVIVMFSRLGAAADRALGEDFTYLFVNRFKNAIVESISDAVTVAVLDEVAEVLVHGTYTRNVSKALRENQGSLRNMMFEKLREDPKAGRLSRLPFYKDISEAVVDAGFRIVEEVLSDPRTDELVADILRENVKQLRDAVYLNNRYGQSR